MAKITCSSRDDNSPFTLRNLKLCLALRRNVRRALRLPKMQFLLHGEELCPRYV